MAVKELIRNKKYKIDVPLGYNGKKRIRHTETFYGGKKEAILRENEIKLQKQNNTYVRKNKITMNELVDEWLESKKDSLELKTYNSYCMLCKHIKVIMGHIKIKDINVKILEDFYDEIRKTDIASSTLQRYHTIINMLLDKAIVWEYLNNNPNKKIEKPKVRKKEISCYTPEEVEQLLECLKSESLKYQAIILLALDTGCRRGELIGLTWEDVNLKENTIKINKETQYVSGVGVFEKSTKTTNSDRKLYITKTTVDILKKYKKEQNKLKLRLGSKWENSKRIFTTDYGKDMHPDTPSKILDKVIEKHNLRRINFHALRHTSISLMISQGIQTQVISKKAGHSSVTVTHNTYSHFFDDEFKEVAEKMDSLLSTKAN